MPPQASSTMTSRTSLFGLGSSALVGSSEHHGLGCIAAGERWRPRCCWPPESWAGDLAALGRPHGRAAPWRGPRPRPSSSPAPRWDPGDVFTRCSLWANRLKLWNTMPARRIRVSSAASCGSGSPSMRISPNHDGSQALTVRHMVDCPEPGTHLFTPAPRPYGR